MAAYQCVYGVVPDLSSFVEILSSPSPPEPLRNENPATFVASSRCAVFCGGYACPQSPLPSSSPFQDQSNRLIQAPFHSATPSH